MKKFIALALAIAMILSIGLPSSFAASEKSTATGIEMMPIIDKSTLPRTIITTDLELDDTAGILLTLMYANQFDIAGIVWSAGMFHWNGDGGQHTLGEITPNSRTPVMNAGALTEYRPIEPGLLNRLISVNYAADYEYLSQNDPNYPTPEELLAVTKEGNIEFEGDVRFDTEGSDWIKQCVLDDDMRPIIIHSWGGGNTWVRALLSIYYEYGNTAEWPAIRQKVIDKVYLRGSGEDNCRADQKIDEIYPGLHSYGTSGGGGYSNYFAPNNATADVLKYYQADWLTEAFKFNHGKVMGEFPLMGDGQVIWGEKEYFQYGQQLHIDWKETPEHNENRDLSAYPRYDFDVYDWCGCQFGNASFLTDFGFRAFEDGYIVNPNYGTIGGRITIDGVAQNRARSYTANEYNPVTNRVNTAYSTYFTEILFEEIAARADWAVNTFENCNHAPIVGAQDLDVYAKAGEVVDLVGTVTDPDGDEFNTKWWVWNGASEYDGSCKGLLDVWNAEPLSANFTVPTDAKPGDYFNVLMEVKDEAGRPMTRFAQFIVHVYDEASIPADVTGIAINTPAEKTEYVYGKPLSLNGLTISVSRDSGEDMTATVASAMVSGYDPRVLGTQTITITYGSFTTSYEVTVVETPPIAAPFEVSKVIKEYDKTKVTDRSKLPRTIITTDLEVDDTNGILLTLMYADQFDIAGLVWSAGMFHWGGDGVHKLGEITPNNRCPQVNSDDLYTYRGVEPGLMNRLISENYAADYAYLSLNNPNYPTPEELLAVTKEGNVLFEGDVRFDTEGSDWIKQCILDDDPRPLTIQSWGGGNTWVRALLSIYEEYGNTDQWETIRQKVVDKIYLTGSGEDNCRADQKIDEIYPGLHSYGASGSGGYGQYFAPNNGSPDIIKYFQADWLTDAIKIDHGNVMGEFHLMGDGQVIWGDFDEFQYGLQTHIDWGNSSENNAKRPLGAYPRYDFDVYDWMCCQFGNTSYLTDFGLRGFEDGNFVNPVYGTIAGRISLNGRAQNKAGSYSNEYNPVTGRARTTYSTRFSGILFEELAARADWAVSEYEDCNHPPVVGADNLDFYAKPGEVVALRGTVSDPDGDDYNTDWWVWNGASEYTGTSAGRLGVWDQQPTSCQFTVPSDAKPGDYFNVLMEVKDEADRPMTRFAQFIVHVYDEASIPADVTGIEINTPADQTEYVYGKPLLVTGLTLNVSRESGEDMVATVSGAMVSGYDPRVLGTQTLTVKYGKFTTNFDVNVSVPDYATLAINKVSLNVAPNTLISGGAVTIPVTMSAKYLYKVSVIAGTLKIADSRFNVSVSTNYPDATVVYNAANGKFSLFKVGGFASAPQVDDLMTITLTLKPGKTLNHGETVSTILDSIGFTYAFGSDSGVSESQIMKGTATTTIWKSSGIPGDINGDGKIDSMDLAKALNVYGKRLKDVDWYSSGAYLVDINNDGLIDMSDIMVIAYLSVQ